MIDATEIDGECEDRRLVTHELIHLAELMLSVPGRKRGLDHQAITI